MPFGDYSKTTYVNDGLPPINDTNLNNNEDKLADVDIALERSPDINFKNYKDYFYQENTKEVEDFSDSSEWTTVGSITLSNDVTNFIMNYQSVKMLENDNVASTLAIYKSISLDLTEFLSAAANGGQASTASDLILISLYISDINAVNNLELKLGDDNANYFSKTVAAASLISGWNLISAQKSSFATTGAPAGWDNITYIRCEWTSNANYQNDYISWQFIQLVREDADNSGYSNPFQKYNGSAFEPIYEDCLDKYILHYDKKYKKIGIMQVVNTSDETELKICENLISFFAKFSVICTISGKTQSFVWYYNASNYIEVFCASGWLYLKRVEAGVTNTKIITGLSLSDGEQLDIYIEKDGANILIKAEKDGIIYTIKHTTTISAIAAGDIYFGNNSTASYNLVHGFSISSSCIHNLEKLWDKPVIVIKKEDESVASSTVLQDDDELYLNLSPNSIFEISLVLHYYTQGSVTPDIKVDWTFDSDVKIVSKRACLGYYHGITDMTNATMKSYSRDIGESMAYGGGNIASVDAVAYEKFTVQTGDIGGLIQLTWAQFASNASATEVKAGSYIKAEKVNHISR